MQDRILFLRRSLLAGPSRSFSVASARRHAHEHFMVPPEGALHARHLRNLETRFVLPLFR